MGTGGSGDSDPAAILFPGHRKPPATGEFSLAVTVRGLYFRESQLAGGFGPDVLWLSVTLSLQLLCPRPAERRVIHIALG